MPKRHAEMTRKNGIVVLLIATLLGLLPLDLPLDLPLARLGMPTPAPFLPRAEASIDQVREKLGLALIAGLHRILHAASDLGRNFEGKITSWDFIDGRRRVRIRIEGYAVLEGKAVRHRVVKFLSVETPLPKRSECQGFFQLMPPEWASKLPDRDPVQVPYRLDLQVDLDEAMKVAGMAAFNKLIENFAMFSSANYEQVFKAVPQQELQSLLAKLFPGLFKFLTTRAVEDSFDQVLERGGVNGTALLAGFGLDEMLGFGLDFGLGILSTAAGGAAAGATAGAVGAAAITIPVIGKIAVGTFLVVAAGKTAQTLVGWTKRAVHDTLFLDRFNKIDWYLLGRYPSGERDYTWFINQVNKESGSEKFDTLSFYLLYLRFRDLETRRRWTPVMNRKIVPILESRARHHDSWAAPKFQGMIAILFP